MYLAIDIGGTKTLFAVFDLDGKIIKTFKFATPQDYKEFKNQLKLNFQTEFKDFELSRACCAVPGRLSDDKQTVVALGNLPWKNVPIKNDISDALGLDVLIENDAKLAALSEAHLANQYKKVLYLTVSTGVGAGVIIDGKIDEDFENIEPGQMMFEHEGKTMRWEEFGSGKAIVKKYGKIAAEIDDPKIWEEICKTMAIGVYDTLASVQPDIVVIGGGVGAHFDKFGDILIKQLHLLANNIVSIPPVIGAKHPEEAVIYGCYEYIKQNS